MDLESGITKSHCVENSLLKRLEHVARETASCIQCRTESQETVRPPGKRASRLTQVIIVLLGLLHPQRNFSSLVRGFFLKIF
jgi:hypothetical protein